MSVSTVLSVIGVAVASGIAIIGYIRKKNSRTWGVHDVKNEVSVRGKIIIITGGSSGLGKQAAAEFLARGATVILPCRTMDRARSTIEDIKKIKYTSNGVAVPMEMDHESLDSVRKFASDFTKKFDHVDILINNAGVFTSFDKKKLTKDGFEFNFGINHLSHFLLTNLLLEHCKKGKPSRIINVSSTFHETGKLRLDDLNLRNLSEEEAKKEKPYSNSKLAQVVFSQELARRLSGTGVHTYALCPGWVYTNLARHSGLKWYNYILFSPFAIMYMRSPAQGCQTILHCALSTECGTETGKLYRNCDNWVSKASITEMQGKALWEKSCEMVGLN